MTVWPNYSQKAAALADRRGWCRHLILAVETSSRKEFWGEKFSPSSGIQWPGCQEDRKHTPMELSRLCAFREFLSEAESTNSSELGTQGGVSLCLLDMPAQLLRPGRNSQAAVGLSLSAFLLCFSCVLHVGWPVIFCNNSQNTGESWSG